MHELKQVTGGGNCSIQIASDKAIRHFAFQIYNGKFILYPTKVITIDGNEEESLHLPFLFPEEIVKLDNKWTRFQDHCKQLSHDVFLSHSHGLTFDILHYKQNNNKQEEIKTDTVLFFSPIINNFYNDNKNIVAFKKVKGIKRSLNDFRKSIFSLQITKENRAKKKVDFCIGFRQTQQNFSLRECIDTVQIDTSFSFFVEEGQELDLEDIEKLIGLVNDFVSFVSFEQIKSIMEISLSGIKESGDRVLLHNFHTINNYKPKNELRPIINFSELEVSGMQSIMQDLLDNNIDTGLIFPLQDGMIYNVDILRYCAAIEYEVGQRADYKIIQQSIREKIKYDELHKTLQEHKNLVSKDYENEFDSAVGVFEKFDSSLILKLRFTHEKLLSYFNAKVESGGLLYITYDKITKRVKDLRNGLAHGLRKDKNRIWFSKDEQFLRALIYMLILTRNKTKEDGMKQILVKICSNLGHFLKREKRRT